VSRVRIPPGPYLKIHFFVWRKQHGERITQKRVDEGLLGIPWLSGLSGVLYTQLHLASVVFVVWVFLLLLAAEVMQC